MELRHLRYFVAVADAGSLTVAAEQKLHTSQPSLSRQIRDLEREVGVALINRSAHGIALTSAGKAFLDHARMSLLEADAAKEAALRAAQPARPTFALGFISGAEIGLLPEVNAMPCALRLIRAVPTSRSRSRICRLSDGWEVWSFCSAATVRLPASATATK